MTVNTFLSRLGRRWHGFYAQRSEARISSTRCWSLAWMAQLDSYQSKDQTRSQVGVSQGAWDKPRLPELSPEFFEFFFKFLLFPPLSPPSFPGDPCFVLVKADVLGSTLSGQCTLVVPMLVDGPMAVCGHDNLRHYRWAMAINLSCMCDTTVNFTPYLEACMSSPS